MNDVFRAGVEPGGLTMDYEIKVLLCYILREIGRPMPVSALIEVFVGEGIGNYFEVASAASSLVKNGHLEIQSSETGEKCYVVTEMGKSAADTFEKDLPLTIRDKAVESAKRFFSVRSYRAQNKTDVRKVEDGYLLTLTINDVGSDLLSITILLPNQRSCRRLERRFLEDPVMIYKGIVALLTGSYKNMGALMDEDDGQEDART